MIEDIPRISVYIISYNQEDVIRRTLESVIEQVDYVYEICVSDDHSTDSTWDILNEYSEKYPGLFKLNRNDPNLGIFENTEKVWTMPTGDIVYDLAGDDSVGEGWFKTVIEYIQKYKIDYKNELFCIYGDYKCVYPNGDSLVCKNDFVARGGNLLSLSLRGLISGRSALYSIQILRQFVKTSKGHSHIAEDAQDRQLQMFTENNYYIPYVGNIYFSAIGVSKGISTNEERYQERLAIKPYFIEFAKSQGVFLTKKDLTYCEFNIAQKKFRHKCNMGNAIRLFFCWMKSFDIQYGFRGLNVRHLVFALLRRIPHTKPLTM